jgi:hypothetical protein
VEPAAEPREPAVVDLRDPADRDDDVDPAPPAEQFADDLPEDASDPALVR